MTAALALAMVGCGSSASSEAPASSASSAASSAASSEGASAASSSKASSSEAASSAASSEKSADEAADDALNAAFDELLKVNPISNQFEIAAMNIEYDFGLAAEDVTAYKGVKSNDNGDAGLVLVISTPADKVDTVRAALETYLEDQAAFFGNYAEFAEAQANIKAASVDYAEGPDSGFVMLVIASNECEDTSAFAQAKENAIDIVMG